MKDSRKHCFGPYANLHFLTKTNRTQISHFPSSVLWSALGIKVGSNIYFFLFSFQCCFTSTETMQTIRDGEPSVAFQPQRPYRLLGTGSQLIFHTAAELWNFFYSSLCVFNVSVGFFKFYAILESLQTINANTSIITDEVRS